MSIAQKQTLNNSYRLWLPAAAMLISCLLAANSANAQQLSWVSPNSYRVLLSVDPRGVSRSNSPASVDINFPQIMSSIGHGTFDPHTIEVVAYDAAGNPKIFDASRAEGEQYLLPWYMENYYGSDNSTFHFVMPDHTCTQYAVYFDTLESGSGQPDRYHGLVGDGDRFMENYKRREINACGYDCFADLDGDGDLDIFKGGAEPYVYCYENVGGNRYVDRGKLTSGGNVLLFPHDGNNRSFHSVQFSDLDGDNDQDMFIYSPTGPYINQVIKYENTTTQGGQFNFVFRGLFQTQSGQTLGSTISFVDYDGDGRIDVLANRGEGLIAFHRNIGGSTIQDITLAEGVYLKANGVEIHLWSAKTDCADIDNDGDLDLFSGSEDGPIFFFENVGTRTAPVFTMGRMIAFFEYMDLRSGVKVADFDGDGLLDFVAGRYWERTQWGEQPRMYGKLYKNIGTPTAPKFEARDAYGGSPYTERFQICDAVRQNGVRAADWNNDGKMDLIASDTDGFVWYFRNQNNNLFPIFAAGEKIHADGKAIRVYGEWNECRAAGYARVDICDWNNDNKKDLLVADGRGWLFLYLNQGTDSNPQFGAGSRVQANGKPIDGTARGSVLVCDWNNDGKKDLIFGMVGEGEFSEYYDWPHINANPAYDSGFLYYQNVGSDANPVLTSPKWIKAGPGGGSIITYSRPNLGDYVDWDGDGKKDFIACEFEHNARFYKNTGSGGSNEEPQFTSSADGIKIVQPWTVQMMSGADAVDFNGDGDLDIITGQGHGASGLRFYERDYINDFVNNTYPIVTIGAAESNQIAADFDEDDDVDQEDFGHLQACYSGDGVIYDSGCQDADLDGDGDVDQNDFNELVQCMSGPNQAPPSGC